MNNCTCTDGGTYPTTPHNGRWYCTYCRGALQPPFEAVAEVTATLSEDGEVTLS